MTDETPDDDSDDGPEKCSRCGGIFDVELCVIAGGAGAPRDRIEGYLCYKCRKETTNRPLGVFPNE